MRQKKTHDDNLTKSTTHDDGKQMTRITADVCKDDDKSMKRVDDSHEASGEESTRQLQTYQLMCIQGTSQKHRQ